MSFAGSSLQVYGATPRGARSTWPPGTSSRVMCGPTLLLTMFMMIMRGFPTSSFPSTMLSPKSIALPFRLMTPIFPKQPQTGSLGGVEWRLVTSTMEDVPLKDGTLVTAYPTQFDYSLIYYPPVFDESGGAGDNRLPSWSYMTMTRTGIGFTDMSWWSPNPFYPVEAEDPALNNLGNEFIPGSNPPKPELISFSG